MHISIPARVSRLQALSCLTRGCAPALVAFLTQGGGAILKDALATGCARDRSRALFVLGCHWPDVPPTLRADYWTKVLPEVTACASASNADEVTRESALGLLVTALSAGELDQARALGLQREMTDLEAHLTALSGDELEWGQAQLHLAREIQHRLA